MLDRVLVIQEFALGQTTLEAPAFVLVVVLEEISPHSTLDMTSLLFLIFQLCHLDPKVELALVDPLVLEQNSEAIPVATVQ